MKQRTMAQLLTSRLVELNCKIRQFFCLIYNLLFDVYNCSLNCVVGEWCMPSNFRAASGLTISSNFTMYGFTNSFPIVYGFFVLAI